MGASSFKFQVETNGTHLKPETFKPETARDSEFFGAALEPALLAACGGRLSEIQWFRTDWQRGGALTGYASWNDGSGPRPAVVKMPVPPKEIQWLERLQFERHGHGLVVPRLYESATELGGYDLAWAVMQRMRYGPLDAAWAGAELELLADAAARFYVAARHYPIDQPARLEHWDQTLARSRQAVQEMSLPQPQRWSTALKSLHKTLPVVLRSWSDRPIEDWCHGDLHLANAMTDAPPPAGPAVLFDLALIHPGHWTEDAAYFESLFWSSPRRIGGADVVKAIAAARKGQGLKGDPHWPRWANIRRALLAAAAPAQQTSRPDPVQLQAALGMLEQTLKHI